MTMVIFLHFNIHMNLGSVSQHTQGGGKPESEQDKASKPNDNRLNENVDLRVAYM